ncbi:ABC transporter substrate-binding protein [Streptomyces sp. DSM 42041]|uniref:ABC transporter substrate-binding protein n=1 Tax=Streptomyces hazeniae TaxID=3075538 RepID=A0ABU2NRU0_9ACTN|nr:ABC transporter substrate-binding protein [Streptomyces sp. DSM 42041]MDT0379311.1 ABC transporter substrate-binding protein [Streptomyces sp. DSM 42041]
MTARSRFRRFHPRRPCSAAPRSPRHPLRVRLRRYTALAATAALSGPLLSGCGLLPGEARADDEAVKVMTWAPQDTHAADMAGMTAMAQAYARWINASGGVAGRRLEVLTCDERNDRLAAARCADRAADEDVVAVVGSYSRHGHTFMPPLEGAGIPYLGGFGVADDEFESPLSYPVNGGLPVLAAGNGRQLAAGGCTDVTLVRPDTVGGDQLVPLLDAGLRDGGAGAAAPVRDVAAPEDATSYLPSARRALDGAEAATASGAGTPCVTAVLGGRTDTFFDSFRRLAPEDAGVATASVLGSIRQNLVDSTGGAASSLEGAYATGWYPTADDPRWGPMRRVVREHAFGDDRIDPDDPGVRTTWIAYTVLRAALEEIGPDTPVTARSLRAVLDEGPAFSTGGLTPKLRWQYDDLLSAADFPRIVNTSVTYQRVRDGRLVSVHDGFVDVEKSLQADDDLG